MYWPTQASQKIFPSSRMCGVLYLGWIHLPHLWIHKYFTNDTSINFHDKVFLHFSKKLAENEEKPCHGNLRMSHQYSTYGSVSEAGEFGLRQMLAPCFLLYRFLPIRYELLNVKVFLTLGPHPFIWCSAVHTCPVQSNANSSRQKY